MFLFGRTRRKRGGGCRYGSSRKRRGGTNDLKICYNTIYVNQGSILTEELTHYEPNIELPESITYPVVLLMVDPDAPAKPSWLHWMKVWRKKDAGADIQGYEGPSPPRDTGRKNSRGKWSHEYVFILYKGNDTMMLEAPEQRGFFDYKEFAKKNGLKEIVRKSFKVYTK
jgi:hypothetical protein